MVASHVVNGVIQFDNRKDELQLFDFFFKFICKCFCKEF